MSPIFLEDTFDVESVAVIGAGPCGLAAAKYLKAEDKFSHIKVFDQRSSVGGVWNHNDETVLDEGFSIPRVHPTKRPDTAIITGGDDAAPQFVSPLYLQLETNIPHCLMNFSCQAFPEGSSLFPRHEVVREYLNRYANDIRPLLSPSTQVLDVQRIERKGKRMCWNVEVLDLKNSQKRVELFDAVIVASGHYNDPFVPAISGLAEYNNLFPGRISHSKFYQTPDDFRNKKVVIVGNSASGIDLSAQISTVCQKPIIVSEKTAPTTAVEEKPWAKLMPKIAEFVPETGAIRFRNGEVETDVDAVVFCTGYFYSYPFLSKLSPPVVTNGFSAQNLHEHMLYIDEPTLAILGVPQRVVPFPLGKAQSAHIARLWAGRLSAPTHDKMMDWETNLLEEKGRGKLKHNLAYPKDIEYINELRDRCMRAKKVPGLENDGVGKIPPYWGADQAFIRQRMPLIKMASRALGSQRHAVKTLAQLGFDYSEWKQATEAEAEAKLM